MSDNHGMYLGGTMQVPYLLHPTCLSEICTVKMPMWFLGFSRGARGFDKLQQRRQTEVRARAG